MGTRRVSEFQTFVRILAEQADRVRLRDQGSD
jgi:hypothetical protein